MTTPASLFDYYASKGQVLPNVQNRGLIYQDAGLGQASAYTGGADQNTALLNWYNQGGYQSPNYGKTATSAPASNPFFQSSIPPAPSSGTQTSTPSMIGGAASLSNVPMTPAQPSTGTDYSKLSANPMQTALGGMGTPALPQANASALSGYKYFPQGGGAIAPPASTAPASTPPPTPQFQPNMTTPSGANVNPNTGGIVPPPLPAYSGAAGQTPEEMAKSGANGTPTNQQPILPKIENNSGVSDAEAAYKKSLEMTPEEIAAQEEMSRLNESFKTGYQNISDQAIPMTFITGQQKSLENRALNLEQPLKDRIALLQAKRQSSLDASKFALERADAAAKSAAEQTKPISMSQGESIVKYNPTTGKYETVASTPVKETHSAAYTEYQDAVNSGYTGSFNDYQTLDANRKASIAKAGVGNTGLSAGQYNALDKITTKFQADPIINQAVKGATANTIADQIIANPGSATSQLKSLYVLVKNLDPDSAVREGELALANQTQSYLQLFANSLVRIGEGRVIAPDAAVALAQATKELMGAWNQTAQNRETQYRSQATTLGLGGQFGSYITGSNLGYNQGSGSGGGANNPLGI